MCLKSLFDKPGIESAHGDCRFETSLWNESEKHYTAMNSINLDTVFSIIAKYYWTDYELAWFILYFSNVLQKSNPWSAENENVHIAVELSRNGANQLS